MINTVKFLDSREMPRIVDLLMFSHVPHAFSTLTRRGFAYRRCIAGTLRWRRRDGQQIRTDRLHCPAAIADTGTQMDKMSATVTATIGNSVDRTRIATRDVACGHFEVSYANRCTRRARPL
jgi:hypothetical protein